MGFVPQQTQVWCWAATSQMLLNDYGTGVSQCEIVTAASGGTPCCLLPLQSCVFAAPTISYIQGAILLWGVSTTATGSLSFEAVKGNIDAGRPMIVGYQSSFSGHVVVLFGYDEEQVGGPYIAMHDPLYGSFLVPYALSGIYNGSGFWTDTIVPVATVSTAAREPVEILFEEFHAFVDEHRDLDSGDDLDHLLPLLHPYAQFVERTAVPEWNLEVWASRRGPVPLKPAPPLADWSLVPVRPLENH